MDTYPWRNGAFSSPTTGLHAGSIVGTLQTPNKPHQTHLLSLNLLRRPPSTNTLVSLFSPSYPLPFYPLSSSRRSKERFLLKNVSRFRQNPTSSHSVFKTTKTRPFCARSTILSSPWTPSTHPRRPPARIFKRRLRTPSLGPHPIPQDVSIIGNQLSP